MALVGFELETVVSEPDALTTRPLTGFYQRNEEYVARLHRYVYTLIVKLFTCGTYLMCLTWYLTKCHK